MYIFIFCSKNLYYKFQILAFEDPKNSFLADQELRFNLILWNFRDTGNNRRSLSNPPELLSSSTIVTLPLETLQLSRSVDFSFSNTSAQCAHCTVGSPPGGELLTSHHPIYHHQLHLFTKTNILSIVHNDILVFLICFPVLPTATLT